MTITTYLFDLDGTIINHSIYARIYPKVLKMIQNKKNLTFSQINKKAQQLGLKKTHCRYDSGDLCQKLGLTKEYYQILENNINFSQPNKKIIHLIKRRSLKHQVGIVSNSMKRTIHLYLNHHHLKVNFIFSAEDAGYKKNNFNYWKKLIKKHKLNPKESVVIGDHILEDHLVPKKLNFQTKLVSRI